MADHDSILIDKPRSKHVIVFVAFLAPFLLVFLGNWVWSLQVQIEGLQYRNGQLHERLQVQPQIECPNVSVTCECPEYDEGWDDAQFSEGCDPDINEMGIDELRIICDDLDSYGYIPGC